MVFTDFEYDGIKLSDQGFIICSFNGGRGLETVSYGGDLSFDLIPTYGGKNFLLTGVQYTEALTATFAICPDPCSHTEGQPVSAAEHREIMRWLNRKTFLEFTPVGSDVSFFGSFIVRATLFNGEIIGYELTFQTNRPFGVGPLVTHSVTNEQANGTLTFQDTSDEVGHIYPTVTLTPSFPGEMRITSNRDPGNATIITGCIAGETIMIVHPRITSTSGRNMAESFNFNFPKIINTYNDSENTFTFNMPCTATFSYRPIRKVGL